VAKSPDVYRQKQAAQLSLRSPVASVDAYGKAVCYDRIIAETVKRGLAKNDHVRCKSSPALHQEKRKPFISTLHRHFG
jgi:hypothetical protein